VTQSGMQSIQDGQRTVNLIKEEMMKIDKLCAEAQNMIKDFPTINLVSRTHRNFTLVEEMKVNLDSFNDRLYRIEAYLRADDAEEEEQPNLLAIHFELSKLRNIRDDAMDQITRASDSSFQGTLEDYFQKLDETIEWYDQHIGYLCMNLIELMVNGNNGVVVRLARVVKEEEDYDKKVMALQSAQKDYKEMASRFQGLTSGGKQARMYKQKFLDCIKLRAEGQMAKSREDFLDDSSKLEKSVRWFFNDLNAVKVGMVDLMPKKWKIYKTYAQIYHKLMHDTLIELIDSPDTAPTHILAIIQWSEKYYVKMEKLGWKEPDLQPQVIDNRESELVREWRQLIVKFLDEWMERIFQADKKDFMGRANENTLERDENGYFRSRNMIDMWRMLREQTIAAGNSQREDVTEGVVDEMFRVLKRRQTFWQELVDSEVKRYSSAREPDTEGYNELYDWLVAVANDQIACIDDNEEAGRVSYLERFKRDFEPLVSPKFLIHANTEIESIRDGYVDLGTYCITKFSTLMFNVDFKATLSAFFTPTWYTTFGMKQMVSTFEDYISDYSEVLNPSMFDILIEELADELLVRYLISIRNKGAKIRRDAPFADKLRDDVLTAWGFFEKYPDYEIIKEKWKVISSFSQLLESDKASTVAVYQEFKASYWDLQIGWVEATLRARDDFDRSMLNGVKAAAASFDVVRGPETIMSKVK
jgi:exocyst complex component 3